MALGKSSKAYTESLGKHWSTTTICFSLALFWQKLEIFLAEISMVTQRHHLVDKMVKVFPSLTLGKLLLKTLISSFYFSATMLALSNFISFDTILFKASYV